MPTKKQKNNNEVDAKPSEQEEKKLQAAPLKPFSSNEGPKTTSNTYTKDIPRRISDFPGMIGGMGLQTNIDDVSDCLTIGRNISLNGEILSCAKLVVEGVVEASIMDAQVVSVSDGGSFKGKAVCEVADIKGFFEGDLLAKQVLTVRAGGQVKGKVKYGTVNIEPGGEISGEMKALENE